MPSRWLPRYAVIPLLAVVYFAAGKLGLTLAFMHPSATPVWPPTGIALAAFLLLGYRVWPGILLGAFLVNLEPTGLGATTLGIAMGNTLEGLAGAYLVNRFANGRHAFDRVEDILKFAVLAGMGSTTLSATLGVTSLFLGDFASWTDYGAIWLTWWLGDLVGDLLVAPLLILWSANLRIQWTRVQAFEAACLLVGVLLVGEAVFGGWYPGKAKSLPLDFLCVPILIWATLRFGQRETATVTVLLSGIAIWGTLRGFGPFVRNTPNESLLLLQAFMGVTGVMALAFAAAVWELHRISDIRAHFAAIVESSNDAIIGKTLEGLVVSWNSGAQRLFGYAAEEVIGKPGTLLIPPDRLDEEPRMIERLRRGERIDHFETIRQRKDGQPIHVSLTLSPITDVKRGIIGVSKIVRDITKHKQAEEALAQANQQLTRWVGELEQRSREITLLSEMGALLQSCHAAEEAYKVITTFARQLFPGLPGFLGIANDAKESIEAVAVWHEPLASRTIFLIDECWALRLTQPHRVKDPSSDLLCRHLSPPYPVSYLCVPIMAESEVQGVLYVQNGQPTGADSRAPVERPTASIQHVAVTMGHHIGLALANLKLRELLRTQSLRDPLTNLFNRRYLNAALDRELHRARRSHESVGLIMADLDHFKRVNDTLGHQAGDALLRSLAELLEAKCRKGDLVCRYGGEEFVVLLPGASLQHATERAEAIREAVSHLSVPYGGRKIGPIAISCGVAAFPDHGATGETLIQTADRALYRAKRTGRNRVVAAEPS